MTEDFRSKIVSNNYRILTQLELLKYIGGKDKSGNASGEGIPVDITVLPDFVLDIRKYNLGNLDINQRCIAIGGRSGRVACILSHLAELYDGFYRPHLITKTGNLGKLLLENEFFCKTDINNSRKLISHIVEREREPRVTIWENPEDIFNSRISFEENELVVSDIEQNEFIKDSIHKSRVIYFSSIKSPNFIKNIKYLVNLLNNTNVKVFIDCTRSSKEHLMDLKSILTSKNFNANNIEGIILSDKELEILDTSWRNYKTKMSNKHISLLTYSNSVVEYEDWSDNPYSIEITVPFEKEDIPERFKAGFLIAETLYTTIKGLQEEITPEQESSVKELIEFLDKYWNVNTIERKIFFGIGLALANSNDQGYCDIKSLFEGKGELFPEETSPVQVETVNLYREIKQIYFNNTTFNLPHYLSGYRRNKHLAELDSPLRNHTECNERKLCKYFITGASNDDETRQYKAIMLDLDGTLLDSSKERKRGLSVALSIIDKEFSFITNSIDFFEENVYELWPIYKELKLGDFRQKWNHKGWYITYILLRSKEPIKESIKDSVKDIKNLSKNPEAINEVLNNSDWVRDFLLEYAYIKEKYSELIDIAIQKFNDVKLYPFKEAFDFVKSLNDSGAYHLYVVSEGDSDTQWLKLRSTGLAEYFPREKVLTTDDAGNLNVQKIILAKEEGYIENKIQDIRSKQRSSETSNDSFSKFKREFAKKLWGELKKSSSPLSNNIKEYWHQGTIKFEEEQFTNWDVLLDIDMKLYEERRKTVRFIRDLLNRMSTKGGVTFYAAAIKAILTNPHNPLESLRDFEKLIDKDKNTSPLKFSMIGDRQENDIQPVIKLMGRKRILAMRLLSGKYYKREKISDTKYSDYDPDIALHSLAHAKALLLSENTWKEKYCTCDTQFYCLNLEFDSEKRYTTPSPNKLLNPETISVPVGLNIILTGIMMPAIIFPLTNKICRQILQEYIRFNQDSSIKPIIDETGIFEPLEPDIKIVKRKSRLLTSLILDTALQHSDIKKYKNLLKRRLVEIDKYIREKEEDTTLTDHIADCLKIIG